MMQNDIFPIFLGATDGAYALARAFYHDYGIRPVVLDETVPPLFFHTACVGGKRVKNFSHAPIFYRVLDDFYEEKRGKNLLLIPMTETYIELVREREERLSQMFLLPHLPRSLGQEVCGYPSALVFLYRAASGECRMVYGCLAAKAGNGTPLAVVVRPVPVAVRETLSLLSKELSRGCYLFSLSEQNGELSLVSHSSDFSPFLLLAMANDVSIPELFLRETVFCEPLPEADEELKGVFSLLPYRKTKKHIFQPLRKECACLRRRGAFLPLYSMKNDRFSLTLWHVLRDISREIVRQK